MGDTSEAYDQKAGDRCPGKRPWAVTLVQDKIPAGPG
jgi:hypothetical protein